MDTKVEKSPHHHELLEAKLEIQQSSRNRSITAMTVESSEGQRYGSHPNEGCENTAQCVVLRFSPTPA
jgi:hypothetical protein